MPLVSLSPEPILRFVGNDNLPLVGGKLYSYQNRTDTPYPTWTDGTGQYQHDNPIRLNSRGEVAYQTGISAGLWIPTGIYYTFVLRDAQNNQIWSLDDISDGSQNFLSLITSALIASRLDSLKQTKAEIDAGITPTNAAYAPGDVRRYGALLDGVTDDTAAFNASLLQGYQISGAQPYWPAGIAIISSLTISDAICVRTDGYATTLQQKFFASLTDTPTLSIQASNVQIAPPITVIGNIATDSGEFNHAISIGGTAPISNITIGGVLGINIRGDVVYLGGTAVNTLFNVNLGPIIGSNVYRNVVSFVGVEGCEADSITGDQVGYRIFDVEPNAGSSQAPTGIHIKYVRGANIQFAGDPTINIGSVIVDFADLDNSLLANSTPGYPLAPPAAGNIGIIHGNTSSLQFGYLRARGFQERLFNSSANTVKGSVIFDNVDIDNCDTTETIFKALFNLDEKIDLRINSGVIALTGFDRYVVKGNAGPYGLNDLRISGGAIATQCTNGRFSSLTIDGGVLASILFGDCVSCTYSNIVATSCDAATLLVNSAGNTFDTLFGIFATVEGSGCADNQVRHSLLNGIGYAYDVFAGQIAMQAMADTNQILTALQSTADSITTTGALTAQRNLVVPAIPRIYTVFNACTGGAVQVIGASGTGIAIASTKRAIVQFDGTNVVRITADT